jgi:hypothetical protein
MSETAAPVEDGTSYELGSVNVDSLTEILTTLAHTYPFQDEASKTAFLAQVDGLSEAGNPHEVTDTVATAEMDKANAEIADLQAKLAEAEAAAAAAAAAQTPAPPAAQ